MRDGEAGGSRWAGSCWEETGERQSTKGGEGGREEGGENEEWEEVSLALVESWVEGER